MTCAQATGSTGKCKCERHIGPQPKYVRHSRYRAPRTEGSGPCHCASKYSHHSKTWRCPPPGESVQEFAKTRLTSDDGKITLFWEQPMVCACHTRGEFCTALCECVREGRCDNLPDHCNCAHGCAGGSCPCVLAGRPCWSKCDPCCDLSALLPEGTVVKVQGVVSKPELNGLIGKVTKVLTTGRVGVKMPHLTKPVAMRRDNLSVFRHHCTDECDPVAVFDAAFPLCAIDGCKTNPWSILRSFPLTERTSVWDTAFKWTPDCFRQPLALTNRIGAAEFRRLVRGDELQEFECSNGGGVHKYGLGAVVAATLHEPSETPLPAIPGVRGSGRCVCDFDVRWSLCARKGGVHHADDDLDMDTYHCDICGICINSRYAEHCDNPNCDQCGESDMWTGNTECENCGLRGTQTKRLRRRLEEENFLEALDSGANVEVQMLRTEGNAVYGRQRNVDIPWDDATVQAYVAKLRRQCATPYDPFSRTEEDEDEDCGPSSW